MAVLPRSSSPEQSAGDGKSMARILVAEDDTAVKSFVSRALTHRGHKVTSVEDGVQALEALDGDRFDLLITDIVMPSLDRSEEHTSELQSLMRISYAVFCLKKKKNKQHMNH